MGVTDAPGNRPRLVAFAPVSKFLEPEIVLCEQLLDWVMRTPSAGRR